MVKATIGFSFGDLPELVHQLRREVVGMLRERAEAASNPAVRDELLRVAADFEAGLRLGDGWDEELDGG